MWSHATVVRVTVGTLPHENFNDKVTRPELDKVGVVGHTVRYSNPT